MEMYRFNSFPVVNAQPNFQYLRLQYPDLSLNEARIAHAAESAGFNPHNRPHLYALIDAVKGACDTVTYPNRYRGAAFQRSSTYPDKWVAGRRKKRGSHNIADANNRHPSIPAFVVSANDILKDITNQSRNQPVTGAGAGNKRSRRDQTDFSAEQNQKRSKTETPAPLSRLPQGITTFIDLTQNSPIIHPTGAPIINPTPHVTIPQPPANPQHQPLTHHLPLRPKRRSRKSQKKRPISEVIHQDTTSILSHIASKLHSSSHAIDSDRERLRSRWEVDTGLQIESVTDDLAALNQCFTRAEEAIEDAVVVIEEKLLRRPELVGGGGR